MRLTAKQSPHRPGISSALDLRAEDDDFFIVTQTVLDAKTKGDVHGKKQVGFFNDRAANAEHAGTDR
ncbi:MAG: hypothetical protein AB7G28_21315 [Pirellulales bacterium]